MSMQRQIVHADGLNLVLRVFQHEKKGEGGQNPAGLHPRLVDTPCFNALSFLKQQKTAGV